MIIDAFGLFQYSIDEKFEYDEYYEYRVNEVANQIDENAQQMKDSKFEVLIIGSSQTEGVGSSKLHHGFPNRIEHLLNKTPTNFEVEFSVINAGISSEDSTSLLRAYKNYWSIYHPDLLLINLSNNDTDRSVFRANIETFIELSSQNNTKLVLILEANSMLKTKENFGCIMI